MDKIMVLMKDKTYDRIREKDLRKIQPKEIKYILIPTYSEDKEICRNYIMTEMTKYMIFDEAIVEYQLSLVSLADEVLIQYVEPVHVRTSSLSKVFSLMNCVYRLSCVNYVASEDAYDGNVIISVEYFGVTLIKDGKEIYDEYYTNTESGEEYPYFYPGRILKQFSELLEDTIVNNMVHEGKFLSLSEYGEWSLVNWPDNDTMGIPMILSNTITFCLKKDLDTILYFTESFFNCCVFESSKEFYDEIKKEIKNGNYEKVDSYGGYLDYFITSHKSDPIMKGKRFLYIDILVNAKFILGMVELMYSDLYGRKKDNETEEISFSKENDYVIHAILVSSIFSGDDKLYEEYFCIDTIPSISEILYEITHIKE